MAENKNHWYDGWFYDRIIAPNQDRLFAQILNLIEPGKDIIDVGCGTGRFSFSAAEKSRSILGIDLSVRNIAKAREVLEMRPDKKISFMHKTVNEVRCEVKMHFDYAVLTYVIHEVDEKERIPLLNDIFMIADKIIIGDYLIPPPRRLLQLVNEAAEYLAGSEHYSNFKNYAANGGIPGLVSKGGFKVLRDIRNNDTNRHVAIISK